MSLSDWQKNGWLKPHRPTPEEIINLLGLADRDLKSARVKGLDDDWRFNIAYNAILQASTAALAASGYSVPKGDSHHFRILGSLEHTIGLDRATLDQLDRHRRKRSVSVYDVAGAITAAEAKSILSLAEELVELVHGWLMDNHPALIKREK